MASRKWGNHLGNLNCHTMRFFLLTLSVGLPLVLSSPSGAQPTSQTKPSQSPPQKALARFLALNNQAQLKSASAKSLLTGEATRFAQTDSLGQTSAPDGFALMDSRHAVARVQGLNGKVPVTDVYFYLTLSGGAWKVSALRSLALTGMIEMAMQELQKKPLPTPQESEELANMKLTLSLDRDLRAYFQSHRAQFEQLRALAAKQPDAARSRIKKLGMSALQTNGANTKFVIGGMVDNTVGYLYSPTNQPPKISPEEYIWVEKIADKWFLFRTT